MSSVRYSVARGQIVAAPISAHGQEYKVIPYSLPGFTPVGSVACVDICGPLFQKPGEGDFYGCIVERIEAALASSASMVVLRIDSPGGDFPGNLEAVRAIRALADAANKPLIAYTETQALSAAYSIACACDKIIISPTAFVGSVGVWCALVDVTAADKMMGQNIVIVPSGTKKAERNPHTPITDSAVVNMQVQVDAMADMFFEVVATSRGMSLDAVKALEGGQEFGNRAVEVGLADRVVNSWAEFLATAKEETMGLYEKALALKKAAEEDGGSDEDKAAARKMLAKMFGEEEESEKKAEDADGDSDGDKKEASAKAAEEEPKKDEKEKEEPKAAAHELAARIHALEVEAKIAKEHTEKLELLAKRPDFSADVRASLADKSTPLAFVRNAVKTWKRAETPVNSSVAAANAAADATQGSPVAKVTASLDAEQTKALARMGATPDGDGIKITQNGSAMTLGTMTPEQARDAWTKLQANAKGG